VHQPAAVAADDDAAAPLGTSFGTLRRDRPGRHRRSRRADAVGDHFVVPPDRVTDADDSPVMMSVIQPPFSEFLDRRDQQDAGGRRAGPASTVFLTSHPLSLAGLSQYCGLHRHDRGWVVRIASLLGLLVCAGILVVTTVEKFR